jgi:hypothetical protein
MCDKCTELDGKIEHYERISASISDQLTIDRIKELVERLRPRRQHFILNRSKVASVGGPSLVQWGDFPSVQTKRPQVRGVKLGPSRENGAVAARDVLIPADHIQQRRAAHFCSLS